MIVDDHVEIISHHNVHVDWVTHVAKAQVNNGTLVVSSVKKFHVVVSKIPVNGLLALSTKAQDSIWRIWISNRDI